MNKATTATSMPIKNRPALTPSITPNKGSTKNQKEIANPGRKIRAQEPGRELLKPYLPRSVITEKSE